MRGDGGGRTKQPDTNDQTGATECPHISAPCTCAVVAAGKERAVAPPLCLVQKVMYGPVRFMSIMAAHRLSMQPNQGDALG
jgi:hypothetical protein